MKRKRTIVGSPRKLLGVPKYSPNDLSFFNRLPVSVWTMTRDMRGRHLLDVPSNTSPSFTDSSKFRALAFGAPDIVTLGQNDLIKVRSRYSLNPILCWTVRGAQDMDMCPTGYRFMCSHNQVNSLSPRYSFWTTNGERVGELRTNCKEAIFIDQDSLFMIDKVSDIVTIFDLRAYRKSATVSLGSTEEDWKWREGAMVLNFDGAQFAASSFSNVIGIWDMRIWKKTRQLHSESACYQLTFSGDHLYLAAQVMTERREETLQVYDLRNGNITPVATHSFGHQDCRPGNELQPTVFDCGDGWIAQLGNKFDIVRKSDCELVNSFQAIGFDDRSLASFQSADSVLAVGSCDNQLSLFSI